jgi:hypothetical protein
MRIAVAVGLGLDRQVGQHVGHRGLLDQGPAEGGAVAGVVDRLRGPGPHAGGRADQAVQARVVDHPEDGPHPAALLTHEPPGHAAELDLGGGQRTRAQLLLEALEEKARVTALDQEAGQPLRRLRQRQEDVARGV